MQLMIASFGQETNTFSPDRLGIREFLPNGWLQAETLVDSFRGTKSYLSGAIAACEEYGVQLLPLDSVRISGGAMMTAQCLETLMAHFCAQVEANWQKTDGMFLAMHGAGAAEGVEDLEGYVLQRLRTIVGRDYPIMSSLDIHANLTPQMLELSDGLFVIKEYPHTDMPEAAYLATKTLIRSLRGEIKPVMTLETLPILLPNTTTTTLERPMAEVRDHFAAYCKTHDLLDATLVQGFSANDQYCAGASVLIVADRAAPREAKELANYFWERRHAFDPHPLTAAQAIDRALAYRGEGYVVINESSDNPGSGCPGDGTHLLRELVQRDVPGSVFCFLYDPETARQAHEAGVGATIPVRIGGKTVPICGAPLALEVQVMHLSDGNFRYVSPQNYGVAVCLGLTARLRHGNVDIIVASFRTQTFDDRPLVITGGDPEQYKLICLKSAGHFRAYFQDRAGLIVPCEMPGLRSTDLRSYPYQKVRRPIYPLDGEAAYPEDLGGISMSTECKIIRDFQRPDPALIELFRDLPVANIDDNMGRTGAVEAAIVPFGKGQLLGTAFTVQVPPGDNLMLHAAMDLAKPGDVIVIDAGGDPERAIFGELMATYCKTRGVRGIVCDGAIRDAQKLSELEDFPVYAKAVTPNGPFKNGPGQINVPITVGGKAVCPGDIVVGDSDGIVFIRPENAVALAEATRQTGRMEAQILQEILEKGTYIRPWVDELLEKCNCQYE